MLTCTHIKTKLALDFVCTCTRTVIIISVHLNLAEMPQEAWRRHLNWLSGSLQKLAEEEEEADGDNNSSTRLE